METTNLKKQIEKILEKGGLTRSQTIQLRNEFLNFISNELKKERARLKEETQKVNLKNLLIQDEYKSLGFKMLEKKLTKVLEDLETGNIVKAYKEIAKIRNTIHRKIQEEEKKKEKDKIPAEIIKDFQKWYISLWFKHTNQFPTDLEMFRNNTAMIIKKLKGFIKKAYNLEEMKKLYEWWFRLEITDLPEDIQRKYVYKSILIVRSGRTLEFFEKKYPLIKALKEEVDNKKKEGFYNPFI